jgi:aminopeptidase N
MLKIDGKRAAFRLVTTESMSSAGSARSSAAVLLGLLCNAACAAPRPAENQTTPAKTQNRADYVDDPHSYARPMEARVTHLALDLTPDFVQRTLEGMAILTIETAQDVGSVVLDTRDLFILAVTDDAGLPLSFELGKPDPVLGRSLSVRLEASRTVVIRYRTKPEAAALQWLTPEQTAGKKHPFLFTQGEAILTRTWIPIQDSPGIRFTYEARITVPSPLSAVMSAEADPGVRDVPSGRAFNFRMREPIPAYLVALAVGELSFRPLGKRSGIYAEPEMVGAAAHEFRDVEKMMAAIERMYGPYRWGRYDLMLLPASFPFGGMENPRMTFASPTAIAGDRSLVSLIAHELAHAWSGNLVTNATWSDLWLNEGVTVYIEERTDESLYGRDYAEMVELLGREGLSTELDDMGRDSPKTRLHPDLKGLNPDDYFTAIPYEKGCMLLQVLEAEVGRERLDAFLSGYFDRFAFKSMTSDRFAELVEHDLLHDDEQAASRVQLDAWIREIGIPSNVPHIVSKTFDQVKLDADEFVSRGTKPSRDAKRRYGHFEWVFFLKKLPRTLTRAQMDVLDKTYGFTRTGNVEVRYEWLRLVIANHYEPALESLSDFLSSLGRLLFVVPLYQDLVKQAWGKDLAHSIYERARPFYHPLTRQAIEEVFQKAG